MCTIAHNVQIVKRKWGVRHAPSRSVEDRSYDWHIVPSLLVLPSTELADHLDMSVYLFFRVGRIVSAPLAVHEFTVFFGHTLSL